ncbi:MAG: hypothetical protein GF365_01245|nr:hypothetical protein [Candidatus Buchananbacteria bacterium]
MLNFFKKHKNIIIIPLFFLFLLTFFNISIDIDNEFNFKSEIKEANAQIQAAVTIGQALLGAGQSAAKAKVKEGAAELGKSIVTNAWTVIIRGLVFLIGVLTQLCGELVILLMEVIVWISMYNRFIDNPYVNEGWVILRDLVNMFFILGLLFIAFVTVLKIEKYQWNKLLARLLIMAILVNFSKTICGLIIDFFQVLMITFVNAYKDISAGNIFKGLAMTDWFRIAEDPIGALEDKIDWNEGLTMIAASILGLIYTVVTLIVLLIFCIILAFRIVALWALVVFSPLAFFAWVFQGQGGTVGSLASKWWGQFFNYCMIGPFMAFFLWLALLTMVNLNHDQMVPSDQYDFGKRQGQQILNSKAGSMDNMISIMMGILMLVGGLKFSQEFAVAGSGMAGRAADKMKNTAQNTLERGARRSARAVTAPARWAGRAAKPLVGATREAGAQRLERSRVGKYLTKAGRARGMEKLQAAIKKPIVGSATKRETDAKHAEAYGETRTDINKKNAAEVKKQFKKEILGGETNIDEDGNVKDLDAVSKNKEAMEFYAQTLADNGKLTNKEVKQLQQAGFFKDKDKLEKQLFLEDMEDRVEKSTGRKKAFSSLVYNEETNEYEDLSDLEQRGEASMRNAVDNSGNAVDLSDVEMKSITEKNNDGTYKLDTSSKAFKDLSQDKQEALQNLVSSGTDIGSDFYNVARLGDVLQSKRKEVREGTASVSDDQANKIAKQKDFGDPSESPDFAGAEMDGLTYKVASVSGWDDPSRANVKVKEEMRFAQNNAERREIIENNKQHFDQSLHRRIDPTTGLSETDSQWEARIEKYYKKMDDQTANLSAPELERHQKLYKAVSAEYDDDGRVQKEGTKNKNIAQKINKIRKKEGARAVIEDNVKNVMPPAASATAKQQAVKYIDDEAFEMLEATEEEQDKQERIKVIAKQISDNTGLKGSNATKTAEVLIENESKIKDRHRDTEELKKSASVKMRNYADSIQEQFEKGNKDPSRMQFKVDGLIKHLKDEITGGALNEDSIDPNLVEQEFNNLISALQTAPNSKAFNGELAKFKSKMKKIGYKVSEKKKGSTP